MVVHIVVWIVVHMVVHTIPMALVLMFYMVMVVHMSVQVIFSSKCLGAIWTSIHLDLDLGMNFIL